MVGKHYALDFDANINVSVSMVCIFIIPSYI
jgi:hypothetical protein